jgi:sporulation protein YlmC with PRC-barrel domain
MSMKTILTIAAFMVMSLSLSPMAHAQGLGYMEYVEQLNRINHSRPEKNSRHERGSEILTDRLLDRKNQVIGEVRDVILGADGTIEMIDVEFNRLKIGTDRLAIGYDAMQLKPTSNGYKSGFEKDQFIDMFPSMLANITTAAGTESGAVGIKNLQGATVRNADGRRMGYVNDVIFDTLGSKALYLYVDVKTGALGGKGKSVSIPFDAATYTLKGKATNVVLGNDLAKAMVEYSKN